MELKHYLAILQRRWPIVLLPVLLVGLVVLYQEAGKESTWNTQVRASIIRQPDAPPPTDYAYDGYYNYLSSEFAIDDLVEAVRGNVFADAVAERLGRSGIEISGGEVQGGIAVNRIHRIMTLDVTSSNRERTAAIADAAERELQENAFQYISASIPPDTGVGLVRVIQHPAPPSQNTQRERLLMAMEVVAALGLGVLIAFAVHYLDDRLHDAETAAGALRLPHLATLRVERR